MTSQDLDKLFRAAWDGDAAAIDALVDAVTELFQSGHHFAVPEYQYGATSQWRVVLLFANRPPAVNVTAFDVGLSSFLESAVFAAAADFAAHAPQWITDMITQMHNVQPGVGPVVYNAAALERVRLEADGTLNVLTRIADEVGLQTPAQQAETVNLYRCLSCAKWTVSETGNFHPWCSCGYDQFDWGGGYENITREEAERIRKEDE